MKKILVTGASKGLGFQLVKEFASDSLNTIVAIARNIKELEKLKTECYTEYSNRILIYSLDFLSDSFSNDFKKILAEHNSHFDVVVNNAGILFNESFLNSSSQYINECFQVNFFTPINIMQQIIPNLTPTKTCHFVNIGSMGGFQGSVKFSGLSIYSSSKAALANLTECLAEEFKNENIKFNCLALGSINTEMFKNAFPDYNAQVNPNEMAKFIADFSLQDPIYINGKVIPISNSIP